MRARVLGCAPSGKIVPKIYDLSLAIGELTMYFVGDVSSVIRRIEQQPVFEPLLLDALVNSLNKLVGLEDSGVIVVDDAIAVH